MVYEPKPGDGALFPNEHKTEDKHPNVTGYVIAHRDIKAGEKLNLAAWTKEGKKGRFQSLRMSDIRTQEKKTPENTGGAASEPDDMDDTIPF